MNPVESGMLAFFAIVAPRIIALMTSAAIDSNRSAPLALQSPTLSPTRSATTAGFLGSSSGMPASTLPTKSAPTSAALVYIPPPSCAKSATNEAPKPYPTSMSGISLIDVPPARPTPNRNE